MTGSTDPHIAVPRAVAGALNALTALTKEPGHKRFVYTSSSFAATLPKPGLRFTVHENTYNDEAVQRVWQHEPPGDAVYAASKVESERALRRWVEEHKPDLAINISRYSQCRMFACTSSDHQPSLPKCQPWHCD